MVKSSVALRRPFVTRLERTYEVVDDPSTDLIISWSQSGKSFIVWNPSEFSRDLLPRCFGHNHFPLFTWTLKDYGIKKVDSELWEFADDHFVKGKPERVRIIINRADSDSYSDAELRVSTRKTILNKKNNAKSIVSTSMIILKKMKMFVTKAIADQFQGLQI